MRNAIVIVLVFLISACQCADPVAVDKVRPQTAQVTFAGGISLPRSMNRLFKPGQTIRQRRRFLRPRLVRIYELLKGPDLISHNTATVASLSTILDNDTSTPDPRLAEILSLAGFDAISIANPVVAKADEKGVESTVDALRDFRISSIGLAKDRIPEPVRVVLAGIEVCFLGVHLSGQAEPPDAGNSIASWIVSEIETATSSIRNAVTQARKSADLVMIVYGPDRSIDDKVRRDFARDMIDKAGADAVLGHRSGAFEGIEQRGDGIIIHNPGFAMNPNLEKEKSASSLVFRLHIDKKGVSWVEAQPIRVRRHKTSIGMGEKRTHQVIRKLIDQSKKLGTEVLAEHGRGIWDRPDNKSQ